MDKDHSSEGVNLSEQEKDFAQLALNEFNKGAYGSCLQNLLKLESLRAKDVKVMHNKFVTEYFKSDLCKTDQFRKNMNVVCNQAKMNMENLEQLEDVEHCIIYYNQAVLLYHLKHHSTALKIMNKVFTFIEPMEESLAHRVCLLLIELHLCTCQPEKALSLISYIENQFVSTENATKMTIASGAEKDIKPLEKEHKPVLADLDAATDAFRLKLLQYRVRCYLYTCALKKATEELRTISETSTSLPNNKNSPPAPSPGPSVTPSNPEMSSQHLSLVCLHAQVEYMRKNYKCAISTLSQIPLHSDFSLFFKEKGESPIVCFYNNMGCIHHYMGKPNLSSFFFNKAVQENMELYKKYPIPDPNEPLSGRSLYMLANNKAAQLMYNLGISLLHGGKPVPALEYLTQAVQVYHDNPRLWLRLAECCIMGHKSGNAMDLNINQRKKEIILNTIGSGAHRKMILNQDIFNNIKYSCEAESYAIPVASLEFASLCLRNGLLLCSSPESTTFPIDSPALNDLQCCLLAASAYVSLSLGDPSVALNHASVLLTQPSLSPLHRFLAHLYSAEALVLLNRTAEAIDHLTSSHLSDNLTTEGNSYLRKWLPTELPSVKAVLQYNLATALVMRGDLDKAADILKHVWLSKGTSSEIPAQVVSLALYIELALGHPDTAHSIVMQNCANIRT